MIVDGQGSVTRCAWLREQPFWRDVLVLCTAATPVRQMDRLRRHRVGQEVLGQGRVDLGGALRLLAQRHRVGAVRVDAGGGLNGALLRAGLADQLSIVIAPYVAAAATAGLVRLVTEPGCPRCRGAGTGRGGAPAPGARVAAVRRAKDPAPDLFPRAQSAAHPVSGGLACALRLYRPWVNAFGDADIN